VTLDAPEPDGLQRTHHRSGPDPGSSISREVCR
jgi:hypothetical protein